MRRPSALLVLAAAVSVIAGCGSGGSEGSPPPSPTTSATAPAGEGGDSPEIEADLDPVTAIRARWGAPRRTDTVTARTEDGYRARIVLEWHEEVPVVDVAGMAPGCANASSTLFPIVDRGDLDRYDIRAVSVLVSVEHLTSNGFAWRPDQGYAVEYDDGSSGTGYGGANPCDTGNDGMERMTGSVPFAPGDDPRIVQFIRVAEKTPDDPQGTTSDVDTSRYRVLVPGCETGTCIYEYGTA